MRRTKRGGWPYSQPPNVPFTINRDSPQAKGLVLWMPWGGGTPGAHRHVDRINGLVFTEGGTPVWVADGERGWSMLFDDGASEYLEVDSPAVTACPFTMACWFNSDNADLAQGMVWIGDKDETNVWIAIVARGNFGGDPIALQRFIAGSTVASTTTGYSINTWHHACGVLRANNDVSIFIDAGSEGTDNANKVPANFDRTAIGGLRDFSPGTYFSGRIADVRFYNRALTNTEVWQLYTNPWDLCKPLVRHLTVGLVAPPPVGGHMTLWGRYWGP